MILKTLSDLRSIWNHSKPSNFSYSTKKPGRELFWEVSNFLLFNLYYQSQFLSFKQTLSQNTVNIHIRDLTFPKGPYISRGTLFWFWLDHHHFLKQMLLLQLIPNDLICIFQSFQRAESRLKGGHPVWHNQQSKQWQ